MNGKLIQYYYFCISAACIVHPSLQSVIKQDDATSLLHDIVTTKGKSMSLYWNYTYIGDGIHGVKIPISTSYKEQIIGFNSTSEPIIQTLAKIVGQNGILTLEPSIPAPFHRRVEVISSNSTLVIHDLQYNDSTYQFLSNVQVLINIGAGYAVHTYHLKPIFKVSVNGMVLTVLRWIHFFHYEAQYAPI